MKTFNLINEEWIKVIWKESGEVTLFSLRELFQKAPEIACLAGDTRFQDFAVLRLLLAILQTVYSRVNAEGKPYSDLPLTKDFRVPDDVDYEDAEDYEEELAITWKSVYLKGSFTNSVIDYLDLWEDRFNLIDETYPFMQVPVSLLEQSALTIEPTILFGKNINRLISESKNKVALFSPRSDWGNQKNQMTWAELARWLLVIHGYIGQGDKTHFIGKKNDPSNGWLYDLGAIYFEGANLFETLWLNTILWHPIEAYQGKRQRPAWELDPREVLERHLCQIPYSPDNLSQLYTCWSRAVSIRQGISPEEGVEVSVVKIPKVQHENFFLEPMTLWKANYKGKKFISYLPRKHAQNQAFWRDFGYFAGVLNGEKHVRPGLLLHLEQVENQLEDNHITLRFISVKDDGNPSSRVLTDELSGQMTLRPMLLVDNKVEGWLLRITNEVQLTNRAISEVYRGFIEDVAKIRNLDSSQAIRNQVEQGYGLVDDAFLNWLRSIGNSDSMNEKCMEWRKTLKGILNNQVAQVTEGGNLRDYKGVLVKDRLLNIAIAHNRYLYRMKDLLSLE